MTSQMIRNKDFVFDYNSYRPYSTDVTHYVISLFSSYYLIIRYMSGKRVVGSTAISEIRAAWNLPF